MVTYVKLYIVLTKELPSLKVLAVYFKSSYTNVKFTSTKVHAKLLKTSAVTTIKLPTDSLDKFSMKRSFMPNFIHSLDAANVHLFIYLFI